MQPGIVNAGIIKSNIVCHAIELFEAEAHRPFIGESQHAS